MSLALAACAALVLWAPSMPPPWLPLQRAALAALMPDFHVLALEVVSVDAQQKLRARLVNHRVVTMAAQQVPPGTDFMAETPQRHGNLLTVLHLLAAAAALWRLPGAGRAALQVSLPVAAMLLLAAGPVVLAGEVWALGIAPWSQLSLAAALAGLSQLILQGGGYAPALLAAWLARRQALRRARA